MNYWRKVVFDVETNGFREETHTVHCIVLRDLEHGTLCISSTRNMNGFIRALQILHDARIVIGHNIIQFDLPILSRFMSGYLNGRKLWYGKDDSFYEVLKSRGVHVRDTYVMSRLFDPERKIHSIEAYGGQFGRAKPENEQWDKLTGHMIFRCIEDCEIQAQVYDYLVNKEIKGGWDWLPSIELEQDFAHEQMLQEVEGVDIDVDLCYNVVTDIDCEVDEIDSRIKPNLPKRIKGKGKPVRKPYKKDGTLNKAVSEWFGYDEEN